VDPLYIVIGLVVLALVAYFLFFKKPDAPQVEAPPGVKKLPEKKSPEQKEQPKPATDKVAEKEPNKKSAAAKPTAADEARDDKKKKEPEAALATEPVKTAEPAPAQVEAVVKPEPAQVEPPAKVEPATQAVDQRAAKPAVPREPPAPSAPRKKDVEGLRRGLTKAREKEGFFGRLKALFVGRSEVDPNLVEQIEEVLLTSDVGVKTTESLLGEIRTGIAKKELVTNDQVWDALRLRARHLLGQSGGGIALPSRPTVVMFVGVNGAGKTTSIGKLATKLKGEGRKVVLAAGDTFRAAAVQQLVVWGKRVGCEVVSGKDGANPGAVIFDAIQKAVEIGADVVLADTAGRLHTKTNLMDELTKVARTMDKALPGAPHETLLVLDATNGQNAMQQAAMFKEALPITGIVLTKLDGTAKGGVVLGVCAEQGLPVRYIGIGERPDELRDFNADEFVEALLGQSNESTDAAA
jgi:fused signal recognition particle receptor